MRLLALDLSTKCTGWALFDVDKKILLKEGIIKPKVKGITKMAYPEKQLMKSLDMAEAIVEFVKSESYVEKIVIEEINKGKNRLSQKTLDGFHFLLYFKLWKAGKLDLVMFKDSDGSTGWRSDLNFKLSENDKKINKEHRKLNKKLPKGARKYPIINKKHLACRFANKKYKLGLDVDKNDTDGDRADAVCLGHCIIFYHLTGT